MVSPKSSATIASLFQPHRVSARTSRSSPDAIVDLHPEERAAIGPMVASRQAEFATGRACARAAMADLDVTGPVTRATNREPLWPGGITGSISHTRGFCVAVAGLVDVNLGAIGIDVERIERMRPALERRILNDAELPDLDSLTDSERQQRVTTIFAAKEAFYKAHFQLDPRFIGFAAVSVRHVSESTLEFTTGSQGVPDELLSRTRASFVDQDHMVIVGVTIEAPEYPRYADTP